MAATKTIFMANELRADSKPDRMAYRDRQLFVANLGTMLSQTREGIVGAYLDESEIVHVVFRNDHEKLINIRYDSYMDIIVDVTKELYL
jgi:hypothetical protein